MPRDDPAEERLLVLAPTGRDAEVTCEVLGRGGVACEVCAGVGDLLREVASGAGALLVADESLTPAGVELLGGALERQEPWSDLPVLIATTGAGAVGARDRVHRRLARAGSVTILERPIPTVTLLTAVRSALSARRRQYQVRELVAELQTKTQRLEEERELRERFVAILAHDLRGPLSTISLGVESLAREPIPADLRRELAARTGRSLARMERMIRDLLDVHRIQAGRQLPLRLGRCELGVVAREVASELSATHGDRFVLRGEERVEGIWSAEELGRALWNLGSNAVKYGAPLAPIEIFVGGADEGAWVSVHNRGPAIPRQDQARLFEPFRRTRGSEAGRERGWGLGLALVRGCAESHGGTVEVESTPEDGTTFTIRLPWDARPYQPPDGAPEPDRAEQPQPH